ncbi:MAG: twin-arginine translocation signal domain-containing protein [Balneolaceae bacterium]|nr:MAG: twin-arginine translocation signal domain-containing protein [Balneolaceae bacterium]
MENFKDRIAHGITRRDFVKRSALTAGAGLMAASLPVGASAFAAGNDELKVALVGCGGRGTGAANQALIADDGTRLVAMADAFRDRIDSSYQNLSNRWGESGRLDVPEERKFSGFNAYKDAIDLADVVILTTPPGFAPKHFEYAIQQGKHVFMEKPVATDVPGVRRVLEAGRLAKEKNLNVVVGLQRRYQNRYLDVLKRIQAGDVGRLISGQVYWNDGGVWVNERQPGQAEMDYQMRNWYYFTWLCGDHIVEQHIHNIDVANWFIGDYPVSAQGMGGREVRTGKDHGEIFDHHFVEFTYPNGQVIAAQCRHQPNTFARVDEFFQFTEGTVHAGRGVIRNWAGSSLYEHDESNDPNPYQVEHDVLFEAIRTGGEVNDSEIGAKATLSAIMGRMATYSGQVITWEAALNSNIVLVPDLLDWDMNPPVMPDENGRYPVAVPGVTQVI